MVVGQAGPVPAREGNPAGRHVPGPARQEGAVCRRWPTRRRPEPFIQLSFLALPVVPSLKITDRGLVDVERFQLVSAAY
ncbi:MAG: hypothetical protein FJ249_10700 [Nitrospira sp.]|nr:hypothetical protein [Nitrospira sp.]